ncbi:MAG TPA: BLUF domain-containing protein [Ramlibacter sp.]|nr:BLUF domain-containing protein [Ramlibacter sp.]
MSKQAPGRAPAEVVRVICASISLVQGSVMDELFQMRNHVGGHGTNPVVKCALLYTSGCFAFWFEGPGPAVQKLLKRAATDPRHERFVTIHRSKGAPTLTEALSVVATQGGGGPGSFGRRVRQFREEMDRSDTVEPALVWQSLMAPCAVATDRGHALRIDRHVALVSAEDNGPIDLLRRVGELHCSPVVYQRFAGSRIHSTDVGLAYVDVRVQQHVTRIHLLSRRALPHRMVRLSLDGLDELVMIMGSRPAAAIELASGVADCVNAMARPPAICQVTDREEVAATVGRLLHRSSTWGCAMRVAQLVEAQLEHYLLGRARPLVAGLQAA